MERGFEGGLERGFEGGIDSQGSKTQSGATISTGKTDSAGSAETMAKSQSLHTSSPWHSSPWHGNYIASHTLPPMHVQIWMSYLSSKLLYMWSLNVKVTIPRTHVNT